MSKENTMSKKVVLDGKNSDWYEKAIFIVKDEYEEQKNIDFIQCAESIIENYMKTCTPLSLQQKTLKKQESKTKRNNQREKSYKWIDSFFAISLCALGIAIVCLFI